MANRKLILHSDQSIDKTLELDKKLFTSLSGKRMPNIGYIPASSDPKKKYFLEKQNYYKKVGFPDCEYFDVEDEHTQEEISKFFKKDIIHLSGGSPEIFLDRLRATGYIKYLIDYVSSGKVLVGISAGAMLMGPSIGVIPFLKKNNSVYTDALNIVDFEVYPHWSDKTASASDINRYIKKRNCKMYCLSDGDCIVVNGNKITLYGEVLEFYAPISSSI